MAVKGSGEVKPKGYYATNIKKGEVSQEVWEQLPEDLDETQYKKCSCCGEKLLIEEWFDEKPPEIINDSIVDTNTTRKHNKAEYEDECKLCKVKNKTGDNGDLSLDLAILEHYSDEELEELALDFKEVLEGIDVDIGAYIAMSDRFSNFLRYAWHHLGLPHPTEAQIHFCDFLQDSDEHTIVNAFRGIGKSWITSVFVVWKLWLDPDLKILVISASKERSDSFSIFTKRLLQEIPVLNDLIPNGERQSNKSFDVGDIAPAHAPSVKSAGITGQITGSRADIIIADDVEVVDNSATEDSREKLIEKCKEFVSILTPIKTSRIIYLGTPQTEESIYEKLAEMGYHKYVIPARYPEKVEKYKGYLAKFILDRLLAEPSLVGHATDPERFDDAELMSRELLIGASTFALQFQLDTELSDRERYPLRLSDLIVADINPDKVPSHISYASGKHQIIKDLPNLGFSGDRLYEAGFVEEPLVDYTGIAMFIDPSGRGTDETAYAIVGHYAGRLHLIDFGGLQGTGYSDANMLTLAELIRDNHVTMCIIEDNYGDGMFTKLITPVIRRTAKACGIEEIKVNSNKELRIIHALEPVMNGHRLVVSREALKRESDWVQKDRKNNNQYSLQYQLTRITKERNSLSHDDRLDALAGCIKYWTEFLSKDIEKAVADAKKKIIQAELDRLKELHNQLGNNERADKTSSRDRLLKRGGVRNTKDNRKNMNALRGRR